MLFFATRRYAVVRAEWPFSTTDERGEKRYTTVSEEQWFETWKVAIRRLALERFEGEATEDMMRRVMARDEDPQMPMGDAGVDGALSLLREGGWVVRARPGGHGVDLSFGRGRSVQGGGWGYDC